MPFLIVALAMIWSFAGQARATDPPAYWRGDVGGWVFAPAVVTGSVAGYLGWADTAIITGNNISVVWFQHEANGTWTTWGWKSGDFATAVDSLRTSLSQPELWVGEDDIEAKLEALPPVTETVAPTAPASGLFIDDPIQPTVVASSDSAELVAALADFGWASAPTLSAILAQKDLTNTGVPCDPVSSASWTVDQFILRMRYESETALFGASTVTAAQACIALCTGCWSSTVYGPWSAWTFVGSTTSPAGVLSCTYSRTRSKTTAWSGAKIWGCGACPGLVVQTQTQTGITRPVPAAAGCGAPPPAVTNSPGSWV